MARASDLLRNFYSGSQIGGYYLPKLGSTVRSLFPSSFPKEQERERSPESTYTPRSSGSGLTEVGRMMGENFLTPKTATSILGTAPIGSSPMIPKVFGDTLAGQGSPTTGVADAVAGTAEDATSSTLSDIVGVATGPLSPLIGGLLGTIFGGKQESPEEIARRRIDAYTGKLAALRDYETKTVSSTLSQDTASAMRQASQIASRQAAALGKTEQTASFAMPATTNIAVAGGRNMKQAVQSINSRFNSQIADAEASMFGVPAEESFSDVMANIGEIAGAQSRNEDFFARLEKMARDRDRRLGYA